MQQTQPLPRTHFRLFQLSFEHSEVIADVYARLGVGPENPWLLLTNDLVVAAVQKHILQICRRYLRDIRSAHVAVHLATTALHMSFGVANARHVALSVARDRPSLFVEDFQFVAMVVCLASVSLASKLEAQVPYVHLTNLLHDYLQRPMAVPPVKAFVVKTESEILQLVGWDALQPAQLSLSVMDQMSGILHSEHPQHAEAIIHFVNRVDDSLMNFVARHRTNGTTACLDAWQQLQRLRTMSVEEFMLQDATLNMSADEARIQIVVNSPCVVFPLVVVKASAQLLRMEHEDSSYVLKSMGMTLPEDLCVAYGHILEDIATRVMADVLQKQHQPIDLLPDYAYAMADQMLSTTAMSKFVERCVHASVRFLVARLRLVCGPQGRKSATVSAGAMPAATSAGAYAMFGGSELSKARVTCVSPPHGFLPPAIAVSPPSMVQPQQMPLYQQAAPQPQVLSFAGQKMHRDEHDVDYDCQPSSKRFCGPAMYPHAITAFTPALHASPADITASFSGPGDKLADYAPGYPSMCGVVFNDMPFNGQAVAVKADHLYHEMSQPQQQSHTHQAYAVTAEMGMASATHSIGYQPLPFPGHAPHMFMMQGPPPQYIFT